MWVITRFHLDEAAASAAGPGETTWLAAASAALGVLSDQSGFCSGWAGRALDAADEGVMVTEWVDVGSYRRALSAYDVKLHAWPFLATARDEPSAFEALHVRPVGGPGVGAVTLDVESLRADDADVVALRRDRGAGER